MNAVAPNNKIVAKFGGTSVANYTAMCNSADTIIETGNVNVVVLSASAGVTNLLVALAEGCDHKQRQQYIEEIKTIQYKIINELPVTRSTSQVKDKIDLFLNAITFLSEAASLAKSDALTDELVSHGELMSSLLFVEVLKSKNLSAQWFDVREIMTTDNEFGKATPDAAQIKQNYEQKLKPLLTDYTIVTQGFIGRELSGKTTTLGRGGSDYTAALIGEAINAQRIDIWTDVTGIYTTDPRIVQEAKPIKNITFAEAAEMATFGSKILHPATLIPAVRSNIPVFVGSSKAPKAGGTMIYSTETITSELPLFRALSLRRNQILLTLHSLSMLHAQGFLAQVFSILAKHNVSVDLVTTSEVNVSLTLDTTGASTNGRKILTQALLDELSTLCTVEMEEDLALVAIIGNHLTRTNGAVKRVFSVLDEYPIRMICYGASSHNICFLAKSQDAESAMRQLHKHLIQ